MKTFTRENLQCCHTFKRIENSLEHWTIFTEVIDPGTVETKAAVCTVHHNEYFKLQTALLKFLFKMFLFLICKCFFVPFYTDFNKFYGRCVKEIRSFSQVNLLAQEFGI
jgi:hypothetical protein